MLLAASGCGTTYEPRTAGACASLVKALPGRVSGQRADDRDKRTASWGDPKIALTCGVTRPKGFTATSACQSADGLDWYVPPDEIGSSPVDVVMTTVGRFPKVEVTVPKAYFPPMAVMADLAKPILAHTRRTTPCV